MSRLAILVTRDAGVNERYAQSLQDTARMAATDSQALQIVCELVDPRTIRYQGPWTNRLRDAVTEWMFANVRVEHCLDGFADANDVTRAVATWSIGVEWQEQS